MWPSNRLVYFYTLKLGCWLEPSRTVLQPWFTAAIILPWFSCCWFTPVQERNGRFIVMMWRYEECCSTRCSSSLWCIWSLILQLLQLFLSCSNCEGRARRHPVQCTHTHTRCHWLQQTLQKAVGASPGDLLSPGFSRKQAERKQRVLWGNWWRYLVLGGGVGFRRCQKEKWLLRSFSCSPSSRVAPGFWQEPTVMDWAAAVLSS